MGSCQTRRSFLVSAAAAGLVASQKLSALPAPSGSAQGDAWRDQGVLNLDASPYAKLRSVPVRAVTLHPGFWSRRRATNVGSSIPSMRQELLDHGRMDNFLRLEAKSSAPQRGPVYSDSDVYKWMEAAAWALESDDSPELQAQLKQWTRAIADAQEPGGYLNTYYVGNRRAERMLPDTQRTGHELYCIGHLLQAGIAYYRATGDPALLEIGARFVDGYLLPGFGPEKRAIVAGHPEIEMALVELYRTTGKRQYLDLARYILAGDPRIPLTPPQIVYMFCGVPLTSRTKLEGHAVRAMYACCGATDYYLESGDATYWKTLNTLWTDLAEHQLYVTGGVGARREGEAFGNAYELPNATAYGESCAAIGNMMWNWRMLAASGEGRFADVMERALYNGINSGMSLNGREYCYRNPLAFDPATGDVIRNPWYDTDCCPPNLERTLASLPGYFYSTSKDGVYVHLYDNADLDWKLASGNGIRLAQRTNYPWDGNVSLEIAPARAEEFSVFVRIPAWSRNTVVRVDGQAWGNTVAGEYLAIRRRWSGKTSVEIEFDMRTQPVRANAAVAEDVNRVAFQRGPLVYCMEELDQAAGEHGAVPDLPRYAADLRGEAEAQFHPELLDGVTVLTHPCVVSRSPGKEALYRTGAEESSPASLRLIPYYAWANREPASMQVWIPVAQNPAGSVV